ncbi:MAG: peptidylprolyl isomerase [Gemmatimonadales bacterium]|jgi:hypothetical protein
MRSQISISLVLAVFFAAFAACSSVRDAMEGHQNLVATAAGFPLTVEKAAELTAATTPRSIVPRANTVDRVVDLWISYVLLAAELASSDEFADLDVEPLIEDPVDQTILRVFHDATIATRVDVSDAALRSTYEREQPFLRVEAYQIFISTSGATGAELDSLGRLAEAIRERARAGEDFSRLARQYSQDPTSNSQGGYLGWVDRGHLLGDVDAPLLAMQPGEISETVRSAFGYHIFKVTDRDSPDFESARDDYRRIYAQRRISDLELAFMDSLAEAADLRVAQGAVDLVKRLAQSWGFRRLRTLERAAVLARYRGGEFTVDDWATAFNREAVSEQRFIARSDSATIHDLLFDMARDELIVEVAAGQGYQISEEERRSYVDAAYRDLRTLARQVGLDRHELAGGEESIATAAERAVRISIENSGQATELLRLSMPLFHKGTFRVYEDRYPAVIDRVLAVREEQGS